MSYKCWARVPGETSTNTFLRRYDDKLGPSAPPEGAILISCTFTTFYGIALLGEGFTNGMKAKDSSTLYSPQYCQAVGLEATSDVSSSEHMLFACSKC